jgi:hypothetical protein
MKIKEIHLAHLHNEEHLDLHTGFGELVTIATPETLGIAKLWPHWLQLIEKEKEAVEFIRKSAHTVALEEADQKRDSVLVGFRSLIRANGLHFDSVKKAAVQRLLVVFDQYEGIENRAYNEETASIRSLLSDLTGSLANDLNLLGINDYTAELHACNEAFAALLAVRYTETAGKTPLRMKDVRAEIDAVYTQACAYINARMLLENSDVLGNFINELNSRIDGFKNLLAQRKGRREKPENA